MYRVCWVDVWPDTYIHQGYATMSYCYQGTRTNAKSRKQHYILEQRLATNWAIGLLFYYTNSIVYRIDVTVDLHLGRLGIPADKLLNLHIIRLYVFDAWLNTTKPHADYLVMVHYFLYSWTTLIWNLVYRCCIVGRGACRNLACGTHIWCRRVGRGGGGVL